MIPWRRKWQPTPVFLPGENPMDGGAWRACGLQSMGSKESDTAEWLTLSLSLTQRLHYVPPLLISPQDNHSFDICYCRFGLPVLDFICMECCSFYSLSMTVRLFGVLRHFHSWASPQAEQWHSRHPPLCPPKQAGSSPVTGSTGPPGALRYHWQSDQSWGPSSQINAWIVKCSKINFCSCCLLFFTSVLPLPVKEVSESHLGFVKPCLS